MIRQNAGEGIFLVRFKQGRDSAFWQLFKGAVRRRKDGKRTIAIECLNEAGSCYSRNQCRKIVGSRCDGNNRAGQVWEVKPIGALALVGTANLAI